MKKVTLGEVRNIIREEFMTGIPEYQFRNATDEYVDHIRRLLRQNILLDKSKDAAQRQRAFLVANKLLKELEKEVFDLLQNKLSKFDGDT